MTQKEITLPPPCLHLLLPNSPPASLCYNHTDLSPAPWTCQGPASLWLCTHEVPSAQDALPFLPHLLKPLAPSDLSSEGPWLIALTRSNPMLHRLLVPCSPLFLHLPMQFYIKSYDYSIDFHFPYQNIIYARARPLSKFTHHCIFSTLPGILAWVLCESFLIEYTIKLLEISQGKDAARSFQYFLQDTQCNVFIQNRSRAGEPFHRVKSFFMSVLLSSFL